MILDKQPRLPKCRTVGQLIKRLSTLPPDLPLMDEFDSAVRPVVYNITTYAFVKIEEES